MIKFAIEQDVFKENIEDLQQVIESNECQCINLKYKPFSNKQELIIDNNDENVIFLGSLNLGRYIKKNTRWKIWCDLPKFECSHYYSYLGKHLINNKYIMMPLKEVLRQKDMIGDLLSEDGQIFIRPSSGFKTFTGNLLNIAHIETEISSLICCEQDYENLVILTSPKIIIKEWRFFIIDNVAVAASQYHQDGKFKTSPNVPDYVWDYAKSLSKEWKPESAYVIDIGLTSGQSLGLVEINSLSCSGMYDCNKKDIIANLVKLFNKEKND